MAITDAKDLGEALKRQEDTIEIEGSLAQKVIKIKATGTVAWAVAIGAIGIAVVSILSTPITGGTSLTLNLVTAPVATTILGGAATTAIAIAVSAGGVGALNKLRGYKLEKISGNKVILKK